MNNIPLELRFIKDLKKYFSYAVYSAKSELKSEVASSYLNWVWWVLEPFCFMLIYTFIFGYVFNAKEDYFPVFIFIGITLWDFFNQSVHASVTLVKKNKAVVGKVYLPKFMLALSKMMVNGFKMLIKIVIIIGMLIVFQVPITFSYLLALIPLIVDLFLVTFGVMCILLHFGVYVEDLANVINIVLKLLFYFTGIFYNVETRVGKKFPVLGSIAANWNPMAYIIINVRKILVYNQLPDLNMALIWFFISFALCAIGVSLIYKNENNYVKAI